ELDVPETNHAPPSAAAPGSRALQAIPAPQCQELAAARCTLGSGVRRRYPLRRWCHEPSRSARWFDWVEERFRPTRLVTTAATLAPRRRSIPLGRLVPLPTPPPGAFA